MKLGSDDRVSAIRAASSVFAWVKRVVMRSQTSEIPGIDEDEGRLHARFMYELLGHELCGIPELRALGEQGPWVAYADNAASFVDLAMERNRRGEHVYVGLQPRPKMMGQSAWNVWQPARGGRAGNVARAKDIEYVTNIALDIDVSTPQRAAGHPASDDELCVCVVVARRLLTAEGFAGTAAVALIPEPAWMDFLVQCAWLDGGDELAHRISRHDAQRYSHGETQARLERIRRAGYRPKRCRHLSGENGLFECPRIHGCPVRRPIDLTARKQPRSRPRPQPDTKAPHESI